MATTTPDTHTKPTSRLVKRFVLWGMVGAATLGLLWWLLMSAA